MNNNINALNSFDPSKGSYLEVAVDEDRIEQLQVVQKNGFEVFIMWLGRIFCWSQNSSTSMSRIIRLISSQITAICKNPQATQAGLDRFLDKIVSYDRRHSNYEISSDVNIIANEILRSKRYRTADSINRKWPDYVQSEDENLNAVTHDMKYFYEHSRDYSNYKPKDLPDLIDELGRLSRGIAGLDVAIRNRYLDDKFDSLLRDFSAYEPAGLVALINESGKLCRGWAPVLKSKREDRLDEKIRLSRLRLSLSDGLYEAITNFKLVKLFFQNVDELQLKSNFIEGIKNSLDFMKILYAIAPRWAELGHPENIISNFVDNYISMILNLNNFFYSQDYFDQLGIHYVEKRLQNKDFLSNLQTVQRQRIINGLFHTYPIFTNFTFNKQAIADILSTLITSDRDPNNELEPVPILGALADLCRYGGIHNLFSFFSNLTGILCSRSLGTDEKPHLNEEDVLMYRPDVPEAIKKDLYAKYLNAIDGLEGLRTDWQKVEHVIFELIFKGCQNSTLALSPVSPIPLPLSPLSTMAITPTKKLMELFSPIDAPQILPNVLILLIMEYFGRGTIGEVVTPKCFKQLYADISIWALSNEPAIRSALANRKTPNSDVDIIFIESDSTPTAN